jgi:hypothetical protein
LNKGYDLYSIRNNLLKQYPQQQVDEVINVFTAQQQDMQLKSYVTRQIALGFKPEMIRSSLAQSGYSKELIDSALGGNGGSITVRHEIHFPIKTVIILLLLAALGGGGYWLFTNNTSGNALLDVSVQSYNQEYLAGQEVTYGIELINMGKSNRFDANVRYTITYGSGTVLKSYSETLAVETKATSSGKITLPSNIRPGTYYLNAIVTYGDNQKAESSTEFQIVNQITARPITGGGTSDGNGGSTTGGSPGGNTGETSIETITTGDKPTFGDTLSNIRQQSLTNPQAALTNCLKFSNPDQKDVCLSEIAYSTNRANYCDQISDTPKKDNCYFAFVIGGNTQICDKISDPNTKQYCNQARIVEQMNYYYQQGDNEKVLELSKQFEPAIYNNNPAPVNYQNTYNQQSTLSMDDFTITGELE